MAFLGLKQKQVLTLLIASQLFVFIHFKLIKLIFIIWFFLINETLKITAGYE